MNRDEVIRRLEESIVEHENLEVLRRDQILRALGRVDGMKFAVDLLRDEEEDICGGCERSVPSEATSCIYCGTVFVFEGRDE